MSTLSRIQRHTLRSSILDSVKSVVEIKFEGIHNLIESAQHPQQFEVGRQRDHAIQLELAQSGEGDPGSCGQPPLGKPLLKTPKSDLPTQHIPSGRDILNPYHDVDPR